MALSIIMLSRTFLTECRRSQKCDLFIRCAHVTWWVETNTETKMHSKTKHEWMKERKKGRVKMKEKCEKSGEKNGKNKIMYTL